MKIYLDHIGIACEDFDAGTKFWNLLGLTQGDDELVADQGVITRFFETSKNDEGQQVSRLKCIEEYINANISYKYE